MIESRGLEERMAADRALNVAELIEGKLARPQIMIATYLCTLMFLEGYDMQTLSFAAPAILREWNVTRAEFGPVLSAHLFGYLIGAILLSFMGDRLGRRNVILGGVAMFSVFTFAAGLASSPAQLGLWRILAGFGLGGSIPTGIALVAEYMPARIRATTIGMMFVGYNLGAAAGGFIAAASIGAYGWSSVFFIGGLAALPMLVLLYFFAPESVRFLIVSGASPQRIAGIVKRLRPGIDLSGVTHYLAGEVHKKVAPGSLLSDGRAAMTLFLWFAMIASFTGHYVITAWMPTILADDGMSIADANYAMGFFQLGGAIGSLLIAVLLDWVGIRIVAFTFLLATPATILLGIDLGYAVLVANMLVGGIAVLGGQIGLNALCGTIYPTFMRATGAGWALGVGRLGAMSGPVVGGYLIELGYMRPSLLLLTSIPFLFCAASLVGLASAKRTSDARNTEDAPLANAGGFAH
jgi:MFS transporter, AAHS family, 4-hydroxybenzoate transporter